MIANHLFGATGFYQVIDVYKRQELLPEWVPLVVHEGFEDKDLDVLLLTDHQVFDRYHHYQLKSDRIRNADAAISLKELHAISPGDYIVHSDHGVGQFDGLLTTEVDGKPREVVKLVYQNKDVLLVSIHSLHKLSKYQAQEEGEPQLSKLGTGAWTKLKELSLIHIFSRLIGLHGNQKEPLVLLRVVWVKVRVKALDEGLVDLLEFFGLLGREAWSVPILLGSLELSLSLIHI